MYESTECPKCKGPRDAKALYCPFCGAVFNRLEASPAAPGPPAEARPEEDGSFAGPVANPYRPPAADLYQNKPAEPVVFHRSDTTSPALASRGSRLGAHLLDGVLVTVSMVIVIVLLMVAGMVPAALQDARPTDEQIMTAGLAMVIAGILPIALVNIYFLGRDGQTLGKKALNIRIVRISGEQASLGRLILLRTGLTWVLGMVPYLGGMFGLADALCIFRDDKRCLHDHIADTMVVEA